FLHGTSRLSLLRVSQDVNTLLCPARHFVQPRTFKGSFPHCREVLGDVSCLIARLRLKSAPMARSATLYRMKMELSDVDRGVYESLDFRIAQHPSEGEERLVARILAY